MVQGSGVEGWRLGSFCTESDAINHIFVGENPMGVGNLAGLHEGLTII
jgi:hypothetical protein